MGYEVCFVFHPRKEDGSYDHETKEEKIVKVGKPFDDTSLEKLAAGIMSQMARRDIWVIDVRVVELVRKEITFKECKDGRGIIINNKKFSFNESAQMIAEDICCEQLPVAPPVITMPQPVVNVQPHNQVIQPQSIPQGMYPHEMIANQRQQNNIDDLYGNPNKPAPIVKQNTRIEIDPKKRLYDVYFEPYFYEAEAKRLKLKFTENKKYTVHQVIPDVTGKFEKQKIAVTDDLGRIVQVEEKYFSSAGSGLMADKELGFSGSNVRGARKPRLAYEGEMYTDAVDAQMGRSRAIPQGIPIDDGTIPEDMMAIPDLRAPAPRRR